MAIQRKCICQPYEEVSQEIASNYRFLTLEEVVAIACGFSSCCAYRLHSQEFRSANLAISDEISSWNQELHREVAGRGLPSVVDTLEPTKRLISRRAFESWLEKRERNETSEENDTNNSDSLVIQRAKAIEKVITALGYDAKAITIPEKTLLREEVKKKFRKLSFTESTFNKAWVEGGRLGLIAIKDKPKYEKARRSPKEDRSKNLRFRP